MAITICLSEVMNYRYAGNISQLLTGKAAWRIFTPVLHKLDEEKIQPIPYPYGTYGPSEAVEQIEALGWKRTGGYQSKV